VGVFVCVGVCGCVCVCVWVCVCGCGCGGLVFCFGLVAFALASTFLIGFARSGACAAVGFFRLCV
jgi:hypothetical protein